VRFRDENVPRVQSPGFHRQHCKKKKKIPRKTTNKETTRKLRKKYIKKEIKL
jgi:hypothetical protein